jgi:hypothetical protein
MLERRGSCVIIQYIALHSMFLLYFILCIYLTGRWSEDGTYGFNLP